MHNKKFDIVHSLKIDSVFIQSEVMPEKFFKHINIYFLNAELNVIYDNFTNLFFRLLAINLFLKLNSLYLIIISILS